ncbi:unnamed protein product [Amoebophrya sp. A25]|nr:unnamed protein product [Amoebophrya sp. A25]|eukprot:GSA25T00020705001.1
MEIPTNWDIKVDGAFFSSIYSALEDSALRCWDTRVDWGKVADWMGEEKGLTLVEHDVKNDEMKALGSDEVLDDEEEFSVMSRRSLAAMCRDRWRFWLEGSLAHGWTTQEDHMLKLVIAEHCERKNRMRESYRKQPPSLKNKVVLGDTSGASLLEALKKAVNKDVQTHDEVLAHVTRVRNLADEVNRRFIGRKQAPEDKGEQVQGADDKPADEVGEDSPVSDEEILAEELALRRGGSVKKKEDQRLTRWSSNTTTPRTTSSSSSEAALMFGGRSEDKTSVSTTTAPVETSDEGAVNAETLASLTVQDWTDIQFAFHGRMEARREKLTNWAAARVSSAIEALREENRKAAEAVWKEQQQKSRSLTKNTFGARGMKRRRLSKKEIAEKLPLAVTRPCPLGSETSGSTETSVVPAPSPEESLKRAKHILDLEKRTPGHMAVLELELEQAIRWKQRTCFQLRARARILYPEVVSAKDAITLLDNSSCGLWSDRDLLAWYEEARCVLIEAKVKADTSKKMKKSGSSSNYNGIFQDRTSSATSTSPTSTSPTSTSSSSASTSSTEPTIRVIANYIRANHGVGVAGFPTHAELRERLSSLLGRKDKKNASLNYKSSPLVRAAEASVLGSQEGAPPVVVERKTGPWTAEEDAQLLGLAKDPKMKTRSGRLCWVSISAKIGTRDAKQARERYCRSNLLASAESGDRHIVAEKKMIKDAEQGKPASSTSSTSCTSSEKQSAKARSSRFVKHWTAQEDSLLKSIADDEDLLGRWEAIAKRLGRPASSVRCRFKALHPQVWKVMQECSTSTRKTKIRRTTTTTSGESTTTGESLSALLDGSSSSRLGKTQAKASPKQALLKFVKEAAEIPSKPLRTKELLDSRKQQKKKAQKKNQKGKKGANGKMSGAKNSKKMKTMMKAMKRASAASATSTRKNGNGHGTKKKAWSVMKKAN